MSTNISQWRTRAQELDASDKLAEFREQFHFPVGKDGKPVTYLCGNSLGLQPRKAASYVQVELEDWAKLGVEGHFHARNPWLPYHELVTADLAALTGALESEVVAMNSLTVNLHLMLSTFYHPQKSRNKILMGFSPFPSDRYAIASQIKLHGLTPAECLIELKPDQGNTGVSLEQTLSTIEAHADELAVVLLEGVNYYTGAALEFEPIIEAGRRAGAIIGLDLAHTIGNLPLTLHNWNVDFAVWCSYKYLNGGPGCVGGCFVHDKHGNNPDLPRMAGWWGQDKATRFQMGPQFNPIPGVQGWQVSNPPILPLAVLRASLELFSQAGITDLRKKSIALTGFLEQLITTFCADSAEIVTPRDPAQRGCQLSLRVRGGKAKFTKLIEREVICDWREPDVIRVAPAPLYNSYQDVFRFVESLAAV